MDDQSENNLATVDPRLSRVVHLAAFKCPIKFRAIEGVRTIERQHKLYGQGRTADECEKAGIARSYARPKMNKVTWTLKSRHLARANGLSNAVDLLPAPFDWKDTKPFDVVAEAMFAAAKELGVEIRWGADWDRDGKPREKRESDSPHFELVD